MPPRLKDRNCVYIVFDILLRLMTIILCGTSHISTDSKKKIDDLISQYSPDIIAVELDRDRVKALFEKEQHLPYSAMFKLGVGPFMFMKVGKFAQKYLAKKVGTKPGVDMKYAVLAAAKNKLKVALIDRHIQLTLRRLFKKLTWKEKFRFFIQIFTGPFSSQSQMLRKINLREIPSDDIVDLLMKQMKADYPSVYKVLVHERNVYMGKKLLKLDVDHTVLAVVGKGHVEGIHSYLKSKDARVFL